MIASQYKITLPGNYDMDIIRKRVKDNGYKTDGFYGLKFKLYLITEKGINNSLQNSYSPLYLWKDCEGLNKFLFEGFYDNIITSFGWQNVNIGVPLIDTTRQRFQDANFLFEVVGEIEPKESLNNFKNSIKDAILKIDAEYVVIYNPDKWKYQVFYFVDDLEKVKTEKGVIYTILHISQ
ncbi:DUF4865 family protein [Acetivibrio mesophilus]|uniref:DUF4865 family protein n=1 Tax=Acetivibrio mesophilus TaxID=2487273 RepID=A0A4Q0I869_9FIRM|nr:DUF4865 family protein [Acetivibrio mesophilus]ODM26363.1 DUF4865 domain-containing protein [Clostridium sp. Bc-iso-3]RXE60578.1 DUF4865 family protein [Acetivibrio mesophilus]HHV30343.1 DUF4865 family protein [Clostridium sp.]